MTLTLDPTLDRPAPQPEPEEHEERWRLTFAGAQLLGYEIDPSRRGQLTVYSPALNLWVRMRR